MNLAVSCFGEENVCQLINIIYESYGSKFPIVSVGSGAGRLEKLFSTQTEHAEIICIDPDPTSFMGDKVYFEPKYSYVDELIQNEPYIIGNCILLLNWCEPKLTYDYEAVLKCKPVAIFTIIERYKFEAGAAGGKQFHQFLENCGMDEDHSSKTEYDIVHQVYLGDSEFEEYPADFRCVWLNRKDVQYNKDQVTELPIEISTKCISNVFVQ